MDQGCQIFQYAGGSQTREKIPACIEERKCKPDKASRSKLSVRLTGVEARGFLAISPDDIPDVICSEEQKNKFKSLLKKTPSKGLKKRVACVH